MPGDPPAGGDLAETTPPNPVPFLIALVAFLVVAVLAFVFLRADDEGELVRPDRISAVDDDTVRAVALDRSPCEQVVRAQVELDDEAIFVELVVEERGDACAEVLVPLEADITLPEPVDGRDLRAGVGRVQIPCTGAGTSVTCSADQ